MASAELAILVKLRDQASSGLRSLSGGIGSLTRSFGSLAVVGVGGAVAGMAALGAGLGVAVANASEAQDSVAQLENALKNLGSAAPITGQAATSLASSLSAAAGASRFGDEAILDSITTLTQFGGIAEQTFPGVAQMAVDMATRLGTEPVAAAQLLGKALNDPTDAAARLARQGILLSEDTKTAIESMVAMGDIAGAQKLVLDELSVTFGGAGQAAAETFGGQIDTVKDRLGEFAETVGSEMLPGLQSITGWLASPEVGAGFEAFASWLGTVVGGAIDWLVNTGIPNLVNAVSAIGSFIGEVVTSEGFQGFVAWIRDAIGGAIDWVVNTGVPNFVAAIDAIRSVIEGFVSGDFKVIPLANLLGLDTANEVIPILENIRDKGIEAIQRVQEVFGLARDAVITFVDAFRGDWENVPEKISGVHQVAGELGIAFRTVVDAVVEIARTMGGSDATVSTYSDHLRDGGEKAVSMAGSLDGVVSALHTFNSTIGDGAQAVRDFEAAGKPVSDFLNTAMTRGTAVAADAVRGFASAVVTAFTTVRSYVDTAQQNVNTFVSQVQTGMTNVGSAFIRMAATAAVQIALVVAAIRGILTAIGQVAAEAYGRAVSIGTSIVNGIKAGLGDPAGTIANMARGLVTGAINAAKAAGLIKSPSKKAADEVGKPIAEGVAAGMDEGQQNAAKSAADLVNTVGTALQNAIKGLQAVAGYDEGSLYEDALYGFIGDIDRVLDAFAPLIGRFKAESAKNAAEITQSITQMVGGIDDAIKGITALQGYDEGNLFEDALYGFVSDLERVLDVLQGVAKRFSVEGAQQAAEILQAASQMVSIITDAIDAITALQDYDEGGLFEDALFGFGNDLARVVTMLDDVADTFEQDGLLAAAELYKSVGDVLGVVSEAVEAIAAIRDYDEGSLFEDALYGFGADLARVVTVLAAVGTQFEQEGMEAAAAFAEAAGDVVGVVGDAVEAIAALYDYDQGALMEDALSGFGDDLERVVTTMAELAERFEKDGLEAAVAFAEAAGKVVEPIGDAVKTFEALQEIEGVPPERMEILAANLYQAVWWMQEIAKGMNDDGLKAAVAFSEAVGKVFDAMDTAVDVIEDLRELEGVPPERFEAFAASMYLAVQTMQRVADAAGPMLENAETWRDQMQDLAQAIKDGIEAIESIGEIPTPPSLPGVPDAPPAGSPPPPSGEPPRQPLRPADVAAASTPWYEEAGWSSLSTMASGTTQHSTSSSVTVHVDARGADSSVDARIRAAVPDLVKAVNAAVGQSAMGRR